MTIKRSLTSNEAVAFLSKHYLNTLIIDVSQNPQCCLPGSRVFPFLLDFAEQTHVQEELDDILGLGKESDVGNDFASPDSFEEIINSIYDLRIGNYTLIYDETGKEMAQKVAEYIHREGKSKEVYYLSGGISQFVEEYPQLTKLTPIPNSVNHKLLGSLAGVDIDHLQKLQKHLVDSVWFGKRHSEKPSEIIPDFLYLSSCHACNKMVLDLHDIKHVVRIGWGFQTDANATFYDFRIADSPSEPIADHLDSITAQIEQLRTQGQRVLVFPTNLRYTVMQG
jgi:hypothetical protein